MGWSIYEKIVVRGHATVDDPTADGYVELTVSILEILPKRRVEGDDEEFVGGEFDASDIRRWGFDIEPFPIVRDGQATTSEFQDWGIYLRLDEILCMQYVYLYEVLDGDNSVLPRAAAHGSGAAGADTTWNLNSLHEDGADTPAGLVPIAVERDGEIDPTPNGDGSCDWPFKLKARETI